MTLETIIAICNNETARNEAATEADGAAPGRAKGVTGMIGEPDAISRCDEGENSAKEVVTWGHTVP